MNFTSQFFDNVDDLVNEKNNLVRIYKDRSDREILVRKFYNGQDTMSPEEAEEQGRDDVTNHLLGHKAISKLESRIYQIYADNKEFIDVVIDTGNQEQDYGNSVRLSQLLSKAIRHTAMFSSLWRSCSGELNLTGRAPILHDSPEGWCPSLAPKILLPKGSPLVTSEVSYAFNPKEMNLASLKRPKKASEGGGGLIDGAAVEELISILKEQINSNSKMGGSNDDRNGHESGTSVTDENSVTDAHKTTVNVWWYYEIDRESSKLSVNATLFTEALVYTVGKEQKTMNSTIIGHIPGLIDRPESWLQLMVLDAEIGGVKTFDTTKGVAELSYNSDLDTEEFLAMMIEGDKARAMPRFQEDEGANPDAILDWNPNDESVVPKGIKEFRLSGGSNALLTPFGILTNNSAGLTSDVGSNSGNQSQLRVQALHSQQIAQEMEMIRMKDVYDALDSMLTEIAYRFMVVSHSDKAKGIDDIKWFRKEAEKMGLDVKELGKREFGRFCYITVRARRLDGGGILDVQFRGAEVMMQNIGAFPPESRPAILNRSVTAVTRDPDFADSIIKLPPIIINQQRVVAENEFDTIMRRASLGQSLPIMPGDIDQDHIPVHLMDMEAKLRDHAIIPWTKLDGAGFKLVADHVNQHVQRMLASPVSNKEAEQYTAKLQQFAALADQIMQEMAQQEQMQQEAQGGGKPMTQKEQADAQLKAQEQARKDQEFELKKADAVGTERQRQSRTEIAERNQRLKEVATSAKIAKEGIELQSKVNGAPVN